MVYSKSLKMSSLVLSNGKLTIGQIMNNMSVDSTFLMYFFFFIHYIWAVPVQVQVFWSLQTIMCSEFLYDSLKGAPSEDPIWP